MSDELRQVDESLRLLSQVELPAGLEDRLRAGLRLAVTEPGSARILSWPTKTGKRVVRSMAWRRAAAAIFLAAAILGCAWSVLWQQKSRSASIQQNHPMVRPLPAGGFSNAGAMRTPKTLDGPIANPQSMPESGKLSRK